MPKESAFPKAMVVLLLEVITKRFEKYGLKLYPEKTRLVRYVRPSKGNTEGKGPGTFDFLGFTHYWCRSRRGYWVPRVKTRKASLRRFIATVAAFCRSHRHKTVKEQHAALTSRIRGHLNYFGVNGNVPALQHVVHIAKRVWHKWLNRRSQRSRLNWGRFTDLLRDFPLPKAHAPVQIWQAASVSRS